MKKILTTITLVIAVNILFAQTQNDLDMIQAAYDGDEARVEYFLKKGANINAVDAEGYTAIIYASAYGYHGIMQKLIDKGAKVNQFKNDVNPVFAATNNDNTKSLEILVKAKANVNCKDSKGYTPLMLAAQENYYRTAKYLISKRARIDEENNDGHTALSIAIQRGQDDAVTALLAANPKKKGYTNYATSPINTADYMNNKKAKQQLRRYGMKKTLSPGIEFISAGVGTRFNSYESISGYDLGIHEGLTKIDFYAGYLSVPKDSKFDPIENDNIFNMNMLIYTSLNKRITLYKPKKVAYGFSLGGNFVYANGTSSKLGQNGTQEEFIYGANANLFRYGSFFMFRFDYNMFLTPNTQFYQHGFSFFLGIKVYKPKGSKSNFIHADKTLYML